MHDIKEKLMDLFGCCATENYITIEPVAGDRLVDYLITNGVTIKAEPQTNADRLDAMSTEERAQFLYSIAYSGETPWSKPFYERFCKGCPAPEYTLDDGRKLCLHECDFKDGKCPHGTDIVWWLQQPAEEGK